MLLGRYRPQRNWGPRAREGSREGIPSLALENEFLRVEVLLDKGTDVVEFLYKPCDLDIAWLTAGGVRDPTAYFSTSPDPLATFLDHYPGGWQEIFPNGGEPAESAGARFGQHGEVSNLPWDATLVEDTEAAVAARFSVRTQKTPFLIEKTLRLAANEPVLHLTEIIRNESDVPLRAMWGHHLTYGRPFLGPGGRIRLPPGVRAIPHPVAINRTGERRLRGGTPFAWPHATGPHGEQLDLSLLPPPGTSSELIYLTGFPEGWYEVENPAIGAGVRVEWDIETMPYLWFWQEFGAMTGYPWYGRHRNIGLEPFSSYPNRGLAAAVANGTALTFAPREEKPFRLGAAIFEAGDRP